MPVSPFRDAACVAARDLAHRFSNLAELAAAVSERVGVTIAPEVLRHQYRRWREDSGAPSLKSLLGRGPVNDFADEPTVERKDVAPGLHTVTVDIEPVAFTVDNFAKAMKEMRANGERGPLVAPANDEKVSLPKGDRPSIVPPDHIVRAAPPESGFVLVTSDSHYPIHDKRAEAAVLALAQDIKPRVWVANGDNIDAWWISRHDKEADRFVDRESGIRIVDEVNAFRPFMTEMSRIAERGYIGAGNHEARIGALINSNPGLHGLPGLRWQAIFDPPPNIQVMDYGYRLQMGPISFVHGDKIGGRFGVKHPTAWCLENKGARSVVFGHSHRMSSTFMTTWEDTGPRQVVAINSGHLSDTSKQRYVVEPNWQHGIVVLDYWTEAGVARYTPHLIPIINGVLRFAGRSYRG